MITQHITARNKPLRGRLLARTALSGLPLAVGLALLPGTALALPQDGVVVAGTAAIAQTGAANMQITQSSLAAVIDWQSFDIGASETVEVFQPSAMATLLNRVIGGGASNILGQLSATGRLTLINPSGITIGHGARIDVSGLIATSANIGNSDFMAGNQSFATPGMAGARISNAGEITARDGGLVALVGPSVANSGAINARLGRVVLAGAERFTLDLYGDDLIHIGVDDAVMTAIAGDALVANSGAISADGGVIQITARGGAAAIESAINMSGVVQARSVGMENGEIVFYGHDQGIVQVSGTVDTSGRGAGESGGTIRVLGDKVALLGDAMLDASGDAGGGDILVGGAFQGGGDTPTATRTFVGRNTNIVTDAISSGDAGTAIVWADGDTRYYGDISARGGALSGDGGLVEVSGKQDLGFDGTVDTSAANGTGGSLLLDPDFIIIQNGGGGTNDAELADGPGSSEIFFADGGNATFTISENALEALGVSILTLQANISITINDLADDQLDLTGISEGIDFMTGAGGAGISMNSGDEIQFNVGFAIDVADGDIVLGGLFGPADFVELIGGQITFNNNVAVGGLDVQALNGVIVNTGVTLTTSNGSLHLDGDTAAGGPSGGITFAAGAILTSSNNIELYADDAAISGSQGASDIWALGALTLNATDGDNTSVFIGDTLHMGGQLNVDADLNNNGFSDFQLIGGQTIFIGAAGGLIRASDFILNGFIDAGANSIQLTHSLANLLTVGFDGEGEGMIGADEIGRITAGMLTISNLGSIFVEAITVLDSANIAIVDLMSGDDVSFDGVTVFRALNATADGSGGFDGILVNANLTVTEGDIFFDSDAQNLGDGFVRISDGVTLSTTAGSINITASNLPMQTTGAITSAQSVTITQSAGQDIALGDAVAVMNFNTPRLQRISAANETNFTTTGNIFVDGVSGVEGLGAAVLDANQITFLGGASTFASLVVFAENGISVNADLTVTDSSGTLSLDADGSDDSGGGITFTAGRTLTSAGSIVLLADSGATGVVSGEADIWALGALFLNAAGDSGTGVSINDTLRMGSALFIDADSNATGVGQFTVGSTHTLLTNDSSAIITAADVNIAGSINAGSGTVQFTQSTGLNIGLGGGAAQAMQFTTAELQNITAQFSSFITSGAGDIVVNTVTGVADLGQVVLSSDRISFDGGPSAFAALDARAFDGIAINADLTASGPDSFLSLDADYYDEEESSGGGMTIADGVTLTSDGFITLLADAATSSGIEGDSEIWALGAVSLLAASDVYIGDNFNADGLVTINADSDANASSNFTLETGFTLSTGGNELSITAHDVFLDGSIDAGAGVVNFVQSTFAFGIGLGDVASDMTLSTPELQRITASRARFITQADGSGGPLGDIIVDNVSGVTGLGTLHLIGEFISFQGGASTFAVIEAYAESGIDINADVTTTGGLTSVYNADFDANGEGDLNFGAATLSAATHIAIVSADVGLGAAGFITAGGNLDFDHSSGGDIFLGDTIEGYHIATSELQNITVAGFTRFETTGDIIVDGVSGVTGLGAAILFANQITFQGGASSFPSLNAIAESGINIDADLSSTLGDLVFDADLSNDGGSLLIAGGVILNSFSVITLGSNELISAGDMASLLANNGVQINDDFTALGGLTISNDMDNNGAGSMQIANGVTLTTAGLLEITAADFDIFGSINAGAGTVTLTLSVDTDMAIGGSGFDGPEISAPELSRITTGTLNIVNPGAAIFVNPVAAADSDAFTNLTLIGNQITFQNGSSTFAALEAFAENGVTINANLTTEVGDMLLDGDESDDSGGGLNIATSVTLSSAGLIEMDADTGIGGDIIAAGPVTLLAGDGVFLHDNFFANGLVTINADTGGDGGDGFSIFNGSTLLTNGFDLSITTNSIDLSGGTGGDGFIDAGPGTVTLASSLGGDIGLGAGGTGLNFTPDDLARISAGAINFNTTGGLVVDGFISQDDQLTLLSGNTITFQGDDSIFFALDAQAEQGVFVNANLTTTGGDLLLDGDVSDDSGGGLIIAYGVTLASGDGLILRADKNFSSPEAGDIYAAGPVTLLAGNGVSIDDNLFASGVVTINTDADFDGGTASGLAILNNSVLFSDGDDNFINIDITLNGILLTGAFEHPSLGLLTGNGYIDAGAGIVRFTSAIGLDIGLGDVATTLSFDTSELQRITASRTDFMSDLSPFFPSSGNILVDNVNGVEGLGTVSLHSYQISFLGGESAFAEIFAKAEQGMFVGANLASSTGALSLDGDDFGDIGGSLNIASGVILSSGGMIFLGADNDSSGESGDIYAAGPVSLLANNGVRIYDNFFASGTVTINTDADFNGGSNVNGGLAIANGSVLFSNGNDIDISLNAIFLTGTFSVPFSADPFTSDGYINAGTGAVSFTTGASSSMSFSTGSIALSATEGDGVVFDASEMLRITASQTVFNSGGSITVDTVSGVENMGEVILQSQNAILFTNGASTFAALSAAGHGITINQNLTTTEGGMYFDGDADVESSAGGILFAPGVVLTAAGIIELYVDNGNGGNIISATGAISLLADNGVTIGDDFSAQGLVTINTDVDGDGVGDFTITNASTLSSNGNDLSITANAINIAGGGLFFDFETGLPAGFGGAGSVQATQNIGTAAPGFASAFLRNDTAGNPAASTVLSLSDLPAHSTLSLDFLLAVIDSWDGSGGGCCAPDIFNVKVDGVPVFAASFSNFGGSQSYNASAPLTSGSNLGFTSWNDSAYNLLVSEIAHSASTATIEFFTSGAGWQGGADESWAIDNVNITLNGAAPAAGLLGPVAYLSFADSPFNGVSFSAFALEDFEDHVLLSGVTVSAGFVTSQSFGPGGLRDSVDADDGVIDGAGNFGDSFFSGNGSAGVLYTFDPDILGGLPTHAGIVWTDGGGTTLFEAFGADLASLGTVGPVAIADGSNAGSTGEDRFFGAVSLSGISSIFIQNSGGGIEADHLQFGVASLAANGGAGGGGFIDAGSGAITFVQAGNSSIGLGGAGGASDFSTADLQRITAASTAFTTLGDITVDGVSGVTNLGEVSLYGNHITFEGLDSEFASFSAGGVNGITIGANLSTSAGYLSLGGDVIQGSGPSGGITFADGVILTAKRNLYLDADSLTSMTPGVSDLWALGDLTLIADGFENNGVGLLDTLHMGGVLTVNADNDADGSGPFTIVFGQSLLTNGFGASITAADFDIDGSINAGAGTVTLTNSVATDMAIGGSEFDGPEISADELDRISVAGLVISNTGEGASIFVADLGEGVNFAGQLTLAAGDQITFNNDISVAALHAGAGGGIAVNADIITTSGQLSLGGPSGLFGPTGITIAFADGVSLTSAQSIFISCENVSCDSDTAGALHLTSDGGDILIDGVFTAGGALTIDAFDMAAFFNAVTVEGALTIDADDIVFNGAAQVAGAVELNAITGVNINAAFAAASLTALATGSEEQDGSIFVAVNLGVDADTPEVVGDILRLAFVDLTADTVSIHSVSTVKTGNTPATDGHQTYGNGVVIFNSTYNTGGGAFNVNGNVVANSPLTVRTGGGGINITGTVTTGEGVAQPLFDSGGGPLLVNGVDLGGPSDAVELISTNTVQTVDALTDQPSDLSEEDLEEEEDALIEEESDEDSEDAEAEDPYLQVVEEEDLGESADSEDDEGSAPGCACGT